MVEREVYLFAQRKGANRMWGSPNPDFVTVALGLEFRLAGYKQWGEPYSVNWDGGAIAVEFDSRRLPRN